MAKCMSDIRVTIFSSVCMTFPIFVIEMIKSQKHDILNIKVTNTQMLILLFVCLNFRSIDRKCVQHY